MSLTLRTWREWLRWSPVILGAIGLAVYSFVDHWPTEAIVACGVTSALVLVFSPPAYVLWSIRLGRLGVQTKERSAVRLAGQVRLHLPYILDRAQLSVKVLTVLKDGTTEARIERPRLKRIEDSPSGLILTFAPVLGRQSTSSFRAASDALASVLNVPVTIEANPKRPNQWLDVTAHLWQPMADVREFSSLKTPASHDVATLGRTIDGNELLLDMFKHHTVVQGQTRSGKSTFVYGLLARCASDPRIIIAGCDPSALTLAPFSGYARPEWRSSGTGDMRAHAEVLLSLVREMDNRIASLLSSRRDQVARASLSSDYPHIIVVLEEYAGLALSAASFDRVNGAKPQDRLAPVIDAAVSRLLQEGAKVSITVLTILQRAEASVLNARAQYARRVSFRVDNLDSLRMLHPSMASSGLENVQNFRPGEGLLDEPEAGLRQFRSDFMSYESYSDAIRNARGED